MRDPTFPEREPGEKKPLPALAIIGIIFGAFALVVPVPVVDVILGVLGVILSIIALSSGVRALAIVALVLSAIGTFVAIGFTLTELGILDPVTAVILR